MLQILEDRHPELSIEKIYGVPGSLDAEKIKQCQHEFDRFLNYIWCICFAYLDLKTLTRDEVICVGRYIKLIVRNPPLVAYCESRGYNRIITVARRMRYEFASATRTPPNNSLEPTAG